MPRTEYFYYNGIYISYTTISINELRISGNTPLFNKIRDFMQYNNCKFKNLVLIKNTKNSEDFHKHNSIIHALINYEITSEDNLILMQLPKSDYTSMPWKLELAMAGFQDISNILSSQDDIVMVYPNKFSKPFIRESIKKSMKFD